MLSVSIYLYMYTNIYIYIYIHLAEVYGEAEGFAEEVELRDILGSCFVSVLLCVDCLI